MLLERERQLERLNELLDSAGSAGGKVVLVRGEAGAGKSALVRVLADKRLGSAHLLMGFCDDLATPQPLAPVWDLAEEEPSLVGPLQNGDRMALMRGLVDLMSRRLRPTLLIVEDTQWADEATLDVIKYVGRRIARSNGLLVLTFRDSAVDLEHPLRLVVGELNPQDVERMPLAPLSRAAVAEIVGEASMDIGEVLALTDGNPLFVTELVASDGDGIPASLQESVLARVGRLSAVGRRLLELTSVIPAAADRALLEAVLGPIDEALSACARQGLIHTDGDTVGFRHELTRRAVEAALDTNERRRLNQQVLDHLGKQADPAQLVHHAHQADDVDAIVEYAPRAARAANEAQSRREAVRHFQALEPHLDHIPPPERAAIYESWAQVAGMLDDPRAVDVVEEAIELRRRLGDDLALAGALSIAAQINDSHGRPLPAERFADEAVQLLDRQQASAEYAAAVHRQAQIAMRRLGPESLATAQRAVGLADRLGDERLATHAQITMATCLVYRGDDRTALVELQKAQRRAAAMSDYTGELRALFNSALIAANVFELELASDLARRGIDTAIRSDAPSFEHGTMALLAKILLRTGEWETAEDLARDVLGRSRGTPATSWAQEVLDLLSIRRGRSDVGPTFIQARDEAVAVGNTLGHLTVNHLELSWLDNAEDPELMATAAQLRPPPEQAGGLFSSELILRTWLAGDPTGPPEGTAEPYRLLMEGDPVGAAARFGKLQLPYEQAIALLHGDESDQLRALQIFEGLGADAAVRKAKTILTASGVAIPRGPGRATRDHAAGLTARQDEVLQLLAQGLTDNEIADELFLSPRTVHHHVAAILSKLDVADRHQATARAQELGLVG